MKLKKEIIDKAVVLLAVFISLSSLRCDKIVNVESKPSAAERSVVYKIVLTDESGMMQKLYGSNRVRNASITIKANMQGTEYTMTTDSNGVAQISGILSDTYFISAEREMTADEMQIISGVNATNIKLANIKKRVIELSAGGTSLVEVPMVESSTGNALVISEIYASGPSGSGLYYHDKYIEIYNQSDSVVYLDGLMLAIVYENSYLNINYKDDPSYVHSKNIWIFPGSGQDYPIQPGQYIICAEDAIDHRINAPNSVDLSNANFEFYKDDAPDVDNVSVPNMIRVYQPNGNDWLLGGETGSIVLAKMKTADLQPYDDQYLIPYKDVIDGVEYLKDPTKISEKRLNETIDAGATGGIQFYTGKSMERKIIQGSTRSILKDDNNSSVDFNILEHPTPGYY